MNKGVMHLVPHEDTDEMRLCDLEQEQINIILQLRQLSRQGTEYIQEQMAIAGVMFPRGLRAACMAA